MELSAYENALYNDTDWKELYTQIEFQQRTSLKVNDCFILANLMKPENAYTFFVIYPTDKDNPTAMPGNLHLTDAISQNILRYKFQLLSS